jgi:hypothetical protein
MSRFTWVSEALAGNATLSNQLGDATGIYWHYHPIRFMAYVNELIQGENRERAEEDDRRTNIEVDEDNWITRFVRWNNAVNSFLAAAPTAANNPLVFAQDVSFGAAHSSFRHRDLACNQAGAHHPGTTPPQTTKFSFALFSVLEQIRTHFNQGIDVTLSHICPGHMPTLAACCIGTAAAIREHNAGAAIDIRPSNLTPAACRQLYRSVDTIVDAFDDVLDDFCGMASQAADLPEGYDGMNFVVVPAAAGVTLAGGGNITLAEAAAFHIHLQLTTRARAPARADTTPLPVRLRVVFESVDVLNDQDAGGSGEWTLSASVNGRLAFTIDKSVDTGDTIARTSASWSMVVILDPTKREKLKISVSGHESDVTWDDSLGTAKATYDQNSNPAWGIGGTRSIRSSNGSFKVNFRVESVNAQL